MMKKTTSELVPFDKVLVRNDESSLWWPDLFGSMNGNIFRCMGGNEWRFCIPYEGNEHLLKTSKPYIPPYRPQDGDFVYIHAGYEHLTIFKRAFCDCVEGYFVMEAGGGRGFADSTGGLNICCVNDIREIRPATSAEIEKILSKVKEIGKKWNEEKKVFEDLVPPYIPQDGDFVTIEAFVSKIKFTAICQNYKNFSMLYYVGTVGRERNEIHFHNAYSLDKRDIVTPATEEEKQQLLSLLHKKGRDWKADRKDFVDFEPPYIPKDGDFVAIKVYEKVVTDRNHWICIFKSMSDSIYAYAGSNLGGGLVNKGDQVSYPKDHMEYIIPATEEEKQKLLSQLHENGKDWNAERKEIVDLVPPYRPQDGDFVYIRAKYVHLTILKKISSGGVEGYFDMDYNDGNGVANSSGCLNVCCVDDIQELRSATSAEIEKILSGVKEIGKEWNKEKKVFEDLGWIPEKGASYYAPCFDPYLKGFVPKQLWWHGEDDDFDKYYKERHLVFRTEEDCQPSCEKMNKAIEDSMSHE